MFEHYILAKRTLKKRKEPSIKISKEKPPENKEKIQVRAQSRLFLALEMMGVRLQIECRRFAKVYLCTVEVFAGIVGKMGNRKNQQNIKP